MTIEKIEAVIIEAATTRTASKIWKNEAFMDCVRSYRHGPDHCMIEDCINALVQATRHELAVPGLVPHKADGITPGAILYSSWGWEQTNIDWYVVVKISGDFATLAPLAPCKGPETSFMSNEIMPSETILWENGTIRRKIKYYRDGSNFWININSYASANLWEGRSLIESHYA